MYKKVHLAEITKKVEIAPGIFDFKIMSRDIANEAIPGQFLNIKCSDSLSALLRRPVSICNVNPANDEVRFIFQVRGDGTRLLSEKKVGDTIDLLGPLGNGFSVCSSCENPLLIGGGIGVFPLMMLAKKLNINNTSIFLGFKNKNMVVLNDEFEKVCSDFKIATDDGSYGVKGYVTQLMEEKINTSKVDIVYACGPEPMLKIVQKICIDKGIPCQLSMEQRMGCGIGACLVCACKIKVKGISPKTEAWAYKHVCKDGPIFNGDNVIFE